MSEDLTNRTPYKRVASQNHALIAENETLREQNEKMEGTLDLERRCVVEYYYTRLKEVEVYCFDFSVNMKYTNFCNL